jgi:hypothetical protein
VQIRALDAFRSTGGLPPINAIKIDVQGAEASVLRGAQRTIEAALEWIWIEFSPPHLRGAGTDPREFLNLLASLKMDLFEVDTAGDLRRLDDADEYIRRIGSAYGDLVLKARPTPQRGGLGRAEAFECPVDPKPTDVRPVVSGSRSLRSVSCAASFTSVNAGPLQATPSSCNSWG